MSNFIQRRKKSFQAACRGLIIFFKHETHAKIHLICAIFAIVISLVLRISSTDFIIILILIAIVLATEMINSAIENTVDLLQPNQHILAGKAKDLAAAAVLFVSLIALCVGIYIWFQYIHL